MAGLTHRNCGSRPRWSDCSVTHWQPSCWSGWPAPALDASQGACPSDHCSRRTRDCIRDLGCAKYDHSMSREHLLFVTGKLAEPALRRTLRDLSDRAGFDHSVAVLPITVVALAT